MKKIFFLLLVVLFFNCVSIKTETVFYKPYSDYNGYQLNIPKKYKFTFFTDNHLYTYQFHYNNANIYIGDFSTNWDNRNIDSILNLIIQSDPNSIPYSDTFYFSGIKNSLYWKEILIYWQIPSKIDITDSIQKIQNRQVFKIIEPPIKFMYFGYKNVSEKDTFIFNKALLSIQPIKDTSIIQDKKILKLKHIEEKRYYKEQKFNSD